MKYSLIFSSIVLLAAIGTAASAQDTEQFPDVPRGHWAYQAVLDLKQKGILVGYPPAPARATPQDADHARPGRSAHGKTSGTKKEPAKGTTPNR